MGPRRLRKRSTRNRPRWRPAVETLESRRVLSGLPLGALPDDTAEYLLGRVAVTPVFFESNGAIDTESQDWTSSEIQNVLQKIREGMDWWVDVLATLDTVHSLEFVYDDTYALDPVETPLEPIDRTSDAYSVYVGSWLTDLGFGDAESMEKAIRAFNHQQRLALDADWAFTVVVVDASDDPDGQFADGGSFGKAFAFAGGMFMVVPSTRPAATFAHEMGHLFWARDEYSGGGSWTDQRGYYNTQNLNAADNPTPGFQQQPSIMSSGVVLAEAFANHVSPASTLAFVGWQDSDGDGIFDVLDVPLDLQGTAHYDAASGLYTFEGTASAVALENQNPSGLQNDVTLNRVSRIEYSVDGGEFLTAISPDAPQADFSFSVPLPSNFQSVRVRAIDHQTGITSEVIDATPTRPGYAPAAAAGYAFFDANQNGTREAGENLLAGFSARITSIAGRDSLPGGYVDPAELPPGDLPDSLNGVALSAQGPTLDGRVGVAAAGSSGASPLLASYDQRLARWDTVWSGLNVLIADLDEPTGDARIEAVGIEAGSMARMEAYDAQGNYLFRSTTGPLQVGETSSLRLQDPQGRIAQLRVFGHARTEVGLGRLDIGPSWTATSGDHGVIRFANLPDGIYEVQLEPELVIHQPSGNDVSDGAVQITVSGGVSPELLIPARRIDSPWTNLVRANDVDENGTVEPLDALRIINDLNRHGSRNLSGDDVVGVFIDTNNDGRVTPADALSVINALNRQQRAEEGESVVTEVGLRTSSEPTAALASIPTDAFPLPAAEGEADGRERKWSQDRDSESLSSTPPAIEAIDIIFSDFAGGSSGVEPVLATTDAGGPDDESEDRGDLSDQKAALNPFFPEPFAC